MPRRITIHDVMRARPMDEATKQRRLKIVRDLMQLPPENRAKVLRLALVRAKRYALVAGAVTRLIYRAKRNSKATAAILASIQQNSKKGTL